MGPGRFRVDMQTARRPHTLLRTVSRRLRGEESGFTLVEIAVASGVIMTALVLMGGVLTSGLAGTAVARERQSANGLANQALETIRALPFSSLRAGLDTTDLANTANTTDPNVTTTGCGGGAYCFDGEQIISGSNPAVDPLVPHIKAVTSNDSTGKTFTVKSYVTYYENNVTANAVRVTVHVSWTSKVRAELTETVEAQTIIFPNGCASLPEHPYSGPCLSSFTAVAMADPATISAQGTVSDITIEKAVLSGGSATSDATVEQTARVEGVSQAAGAVLDTASSAEQTIGRGSVASQADNDPGASKPIYQSSDLPSQAAASTTVTTPTGSLTAERTAGDTGKTTSTTSASTAAARPCPLVTGFPDGTDELPCGGSTVTAGSTTTLSAGFDVNGLNAAPFPLAAIGAQTDASKAVTDRSSSTGINTSRATLSRSALNFSLGGLPNDPLIKPSGFDYFVKITGYGDSAVTEAGVGSTAPSSPSTTGQLQYWNNGTYTPVDLSSITPGNVPAIPALSLNVPDYNAQVSMSATVTPESRTTTSSCSGTCTRTSASAKVAPLEVSVTLKITVAGQTALDVTTVLDPGTIQSKASHVAAPTS